VNGDRDQQKQGGGYDEGQADYGSPRAGADDGMSGGKGGGGGEGMSKEEWLRQNPDGAFDPDEAPGEGMSKEEWLRQNPGKSQDQGADQGSDQGGGGGGGRF